MYSHSALEFPTHNFDFHLPLFWPDQDKLIIECTVRGVTVTLLLWVFT